MSDEVYWCERIWYWPYYGFCPSEKAWYAEMKNSEKWIVTGGFASIPPYPDPKEASVNRLRLVETGDGEPVDKLVQIVTINPRLDDKPIDTVMGIIVHETTHVFRAMCEEIGEDQPSFEFAAYTLQTMAQQLLKGYLTTRRPGEFVTSGSNETEAENAKEPPVVTDGGKAASDSSRTVPPHQASPTPAAIAGPKASHPRRRKGARLLPPAR